MTADSRIVDCDTVGCMDLPADWPTPVTEHLRRVHGTPVAIEPLRGMSVARVFRVRFPRGSVVVKRTPRAAEAAFYERVAGRLRGAGVPIPELEWMAHLPEAHWLILEDIPRPLPAPLPGPWRPDPRVVTVLARLHRATRDWAIDFPEPAARVWSDRVTDAALRCFPAGAAVQIAPTLRALQHEAAHLADGWCWISGDASPPNWGVRGDGSVALYDWELFRQGVPAGDLATIVPGLGDGAAYRQAAARYLDEWHGMGETLPWSLDRLARDVALAKVATVAMLLRAYAEGTARVPDDYANRLIEAVPAWMGRLR